MTIYELTARNQAIFSIIDSDPVWFLISGSAVLLISIGFCLWAYSSVVNLGHGVNSGQFRAPVLRLPYQEKRVRRQESRGMGGHNTNQTHAYQSRHERVRRTSHAYREEAGRTHSTRASSASSSGSSSPPPAYELGASTYRRRHHQHSSPAARQRTESSNLMYSRSGIRPHAHIPRPEADGYAGVRVNTRTYDPPPPPPTAPRRIYVEERFVERFEEDDHGEGPSRGPPPPPGPSRGPKH